MNYIKQLNQFYEFQLINPINSNSLSLYMTLLHINNKCNWTKDFTVANTTLMILTGLNISALQRARNILIQNEYIKYRKGHSNSAGYYTIVDFEQQNEQQCEQQSEQQNDSTTNTLNKLNKTKQNNKKNIKKKFGEYGNVFFSDEQYEKLLEEFPNDYKSRIQKLDDYMQSRGKKYKDCLATIRNWARKEGYKKPAKTEEGLREIDVSELTEEEYMKLVKNEITLEELIQKGKLNV